MSRSVNPLLAIDPLLSSLCQCIEQPLAFSFTSKQIHLVICVSQARFAFSSVGALMVGLISLGLRTGIVTVSHPSNLVPHTRSGAVYCLHPSRLRLSFTLSNAHT